MAANGARGEFVVELAGKTLTLVPSFKRLAQVEAALGRSIVKVLRQLETDQDVTFGDAATLLSLLAREPKLSQERAGELVVDEGLANVLAAVIPPLFRAVMGTGDDGDDEGKPAGDGPSAE